MAELDAAPNLDATRITERLFLGTSPPEGPRLRALGFTFAVFAAWELQPSPALFPGVRVAHAPLMDDFESRLADDAWDAAFAVARRAAQHHRDQNGTVLVSCSAGQNRSGLLTAMILSIEAPTTPIGRIVRHVRLRRSGALTNPRFVEALRQRFGRRPLHRG